MKLFSLPLLADIQGKLSRGSTSVSVYPFKPRAKTAQGDHLFALSSERPTDNTGWELPCETRLSVEWISPLTKSAIENTAAAIDIEPPIQSLYGAGHCRDTLDIWALTESEEGHPYEFACVVYGWPHAQSSPCWIGAGESTHARIPDNVSQL